MKKELETKTEYLEPVGFKGTPGKWLAHSNGVHPLFDDHGENPIAEMIEPSYSDEAAFNAAIMGQSKELAKALQNMIEQYGNFETGALTNAKQVLKEAGL